MRNWNLEARTSAPALRTGDNGAGFLLTPPLLCARSLSLGSLRCICVLSLFVCVVLSALRVSSLIGICRQLYSYDVARVSSTGGTGAKIGKSCYCRYVLSLQRTYGYRSEQTPWHPIRPSCCWRTCEIARIRGWRAASRPRLSLRHYERAC